MEDTQLEGWAPMNSVSLMEKLLEIERAIGEEEPLTIRLMLHDAQECVLRMQRDLICSPNRRTGFFEEHEALRV